MFSDIINKVLSLKENFNDELEQLDKNLNNFLNSCLPEGVSKKQFSKGKKIRSILFFHFSRNAARTDRQQKIILLIEAIHFASLIHDDIVDQNLLRRNSESFFGSFGTKLSLLFGDRLLSKIYSEFHQAKFDFFVETQFFKACSETAYGALLERNLTLNSSVEEYFKMAYLKTSSIFKLACALGALSSQDFKSVKRAATFGTCFGIIFQVQNDLDSFKTKFFKDSEDYVQKNITLPILIVSRRPDFSKELFQKNSQENFEHIQKIMNTEDFRTAVFKKTLKYAKIVERFLNI